MVGGRTGHVTRWLNIAGSMVELCQSDICACLILLSESHADRSRIAGSGDSSSCTLILCIGQGRKCKEDSIELEGSFTSTLRVFVRHSKAYRELYLG